MTNLEAAISAMYSNVDGTPDEINAQVARFNRYSDQEILDAYNETHDPAEPHKLADASKALAFILAGNAYFTVCSLKTGARYTFRVSRPKDNVPNGSWPSRDRARWASQQNQAPVHFVSFLSGSSNETDYTYLGMIKQSQFSATKKSAGLADSTPFKAFQYVWNHLRRVELPPQTEIWHEGRCGRCGRKLTVPESIEAGIGPECATRLA